VPLLSRASACKLPLRAGFRTAHRSRCERFIGIAPIARTQTGEICLDILKGDAWTPAWTLQSVCRAVMALLSSPEADSPLNCDAGNLIRNGDQRGFNSMARMYTQLHAMPEPAASACATPSKGC
jgi:hypothetical protein